MTENKKNTQAKQPLSESVSELNKTSPKMAQDSMENISKITDVHVQNSTGGISNCAPVSTASKPVTSQSQSGSIGACAPETEKKE